MGFLRNRHYISPDMSHRTRILYVWTNIFHVRLFRWGAAYCTPTPNQRKAGKERKSEAVDLRTGTEGSIEKSK